MLKYSSNLMYLFLVIITFIFFSFPINAEAYIQTFDDSDSLTDFDIDLNGGTILISNGEMLMSAKKGTSFPYIRLLSKNIPVINFAEIRFRYPLLSNFGTGVVFDINTPLNGLTYDYDVGHNSYVWAWGDSSGVYLGYYPFQYILLNNDNLYHTLRFEKVVGGYSVYRDGVYVGEITTAKEIKSVWFGNPQVTASDDNWSSISIDHLLINEDMQPMSSPQPSPSPSPSSTASPTPNPTPSSIDFPYYSQNDSRWGGQVYDTSIHWADKGKVGIDRWGCALTSAAMILKKYKINSMTGEEITPALLNTWLKTQPDGYLRNGLVNWLAISRLTLRSYEARKSPTKLEFSKQIYNEDVTDLYIKAGLSPILGMPGHFVVAYEDVGDSYRVNDPNNKAGILLSKSSTYLSTNTFRPSHTDFSYLLLVVDPKIELSVKDATGSAMKSLSTEEYLNDDKDFGASSHVKLVYFSKPRTGKYNITLTNTTNEDGFVDIYAYDTQGKVTTKQLVVEQNTQTEYRFDYDKDNANKTRFEKWFWIRLYWRLWRNWIWR